MQKPQLPTWPWEKWTIFMSSDLIYESNRGALFCNARLQLQTACLASTLQDTVSSPSFRELKRYLELEWGTNGKLDHKREHYSGWFAALQTRYCVLHHLGLPGYIQGLPVEHSPVIQPQGYNCHHLLKSLQRLCSANNITVQQVSRTTASGHMHAYLHTHGEIRRMVIPQKGQWCWKRNFYLQHRLYSFFVTI